MANTPELWVAIGFIVFVAVLLGLGVHKKVASMLDTRAERIAQELEEAKRLREDAHKLLAEYQRKRRQAEEEAEAIVTAAKVEAERLAKEAKAKAEEYVARRTKSAEEKISQAEAQAVAEVKAAAADAAVAAAGRIFTGSVKGKVASDLLDNGIAEVRAKLN
ncbi:ATP synthase subunit b 1 [Agaricicola taiwanensis]|uniref:ATP synthase subunit b n=1 Tax=Agaricicola taiwanensis TaxID=591372 RepID=A0A8J2VNJ1_9RHOB|nr:ATP F0F1 synthase subunit B [Agaricicola taiwanensis]GGE34842.1 ATP synthase subunit b 1 [Agaricicola taiwanensis]